MLVSLISTLGLDDKVKFVGEKFNREKEQFLNDAYILVLPSESENFGNVVTEALSQSTPVIASTGTPWHILKDKNVGWWVDNHPESLKKAIDEALSLSESEYLFKCKKSRELVLDKYNISTSPDNRWIQLYESIL
jgi:glycosyltransferase involved in cell wall biosynthesis